ncbi:hypothetical protein CHR55_27225 [Rhodococcus qingshengii]|uniref:Uncharacterized protein n=1 Tax=Rhodococcus qingshengii TaxID=334542 RepID=A0A2A5J451_RHOSG|nr:hypothetical protein CHR55_27225 [Rhodococcus qingshengii]
MNLITFDQLATEQWKCEETKRQSRMQCMCGRFVRPGSYWEQNEIGERRFGWNCSRCGDVVEYE